jgi:hypothetical protein
MCVAAAVFNVGGNFKTERDGTNARPLLSLKDQRKLTVARFQTLPSNRIPPNINFQYREIALPSHKISRTLPCSQ